MDTKLQNIFQRQEWEDSHLLRYHMEAVIQREYLGADRLIYKRHAGYREPLPAPIPTRTASISSIRKHSTAQRLYFHSHDFYEIIYVQNGTHTQYIGNFNTEITLMPGQAILLCPGTVHALEPVNETDFIIKLVIPQKIFVETVGKVKSFCRLDGLFSNSESNSPSWYIYPAHPLQTANSVERLIFQLANEYYFGKNQNNITKYLKRLLTAFFCDRKMNENTLMSEQLTAYINAHLQTALLTEFAAYVGYSSRHIQRLLNANGMTFSYLLRKQRVEKAEELLSSSTDSVEEIAHKIGFVTVAGFYKSFEIYYHMTPGQYRKYHSKHR